MYAMVPGTVARFLRTVTLTGIDDYTDLAELRSTSVEYPWAEFAVLLGQRNVTGGRKEFPSIATLMSIQSIATSRDAAPPTLNIAGHACGRWASRLLRGKMDVLDELPLAAWQMCSRLQLNVGWDVDSDKLSADAIRLDALADHDATRHLRAIIVQCGANETVARAAAAAQPESGPRVQVLFDESGGHGTPLGRYRYWPGVECGFAGGLTPGNVGDYCTDISDYLTCIGPVPDRATWADAQSGLRDEEDRFSIRLAREFLEGTARFVVEAE